MPSRLKSVIRWPFQKFGIGELIRQRALDNPQTAMALFLHRKGGRRDDTAVCAAEEQALAVRAAFSMPTVRCCAANGGNTEARAARIEMDNDPRLANCHTAQRRSM